jgi:hypothetical protein
MDDDGDVIGIVEGGGGEIERGIVKVPFRRSELPDKLVEVMPVLLVAEPAACGGKIKLVPSGELSLGGSGFWLAAWLPIRYPLTETCALQRSGQSTAIMLAVRAPQSNPARIAFSILSASIKAMMSKATTDCWPFRSVSLERKRVEP